jgi:hypothetical protein
MKNPILLLLLFFSSVASAKNYYVSSSGKNTNSGTSASAPWQTLAKVNSSFSLFAPGDSILFRRGDVFYGSLVIGKSGSSGRPIVIGAYGSGAKPVFSGYTTLTAWTSIGGGKYQVSVPRAKTTLNMVTLNNKPQALGRYPNADAANGGYLTYESFSGATSITDNQLTTATNWTGATAVVRKVMWVTNRCKITAHSGGTLRIDDKTGFVGTAGYGYFIQDDARTLDKLGEWYLNKSTKVLQMYFGTATPSSYTVKASTVDTLINITSRSYINITNIALEGANGSAIYGSSCNYINIKDCDIKNAGETGVYTAGANSLVLENITTNNVLSNGISVNGSNSSNITIRGCSVKNTGTLVGMGRDNPGSYKGIQALIYSNLLIEYNRVDTTGYVGLEFRGNNCTIANNWVNYFCFVKDNGGGIYTWTDGTDADPGSYYTNRVVKNNIVGNSVGAPLGRTGVNYYDDGIFMDGRSMNVIVTGNTVFNNNRSGINCNNPVNVTITNNTSYNNRVNQVSAVRWYTGSIKNLVVKNNIMYATSITQRNFHYQNTGLNEPSTTTLQAAVKSIAGGVDSNYYSTLNPTGIGFTINPVHTQSQVPQTPLSLEAWKSFSNFDLHGKSPAKAPLTYKLNKLLSSNKVSNGTFSLNLLGIVVFGSGSLGTWDGTGKISGGSLKLTFSAPDAGTYTQSRFSVGTVSAAKKYLLRFTTVGTKLQGIARTYLRGSSSPYTVLTPTQVQVSTYTTSKKTHEMLFSAPAGASSAEVVIEIEKNSGTTYIDNVELFEADATVYQKEDQLRFEYNNTKVSKTISLGANYVAVDGTTYPGSITLKPFTSKILVKDGGTVTAPPPATTTALKVAAPTTTSIACFDATATATVTASGGEAPYTGTGKYNVSAGKGCFKITPKTAVPGVYSHIYYGVGPVSSDKNYVLKFSTLRNTGTGTIRAALMQLNTPWNLLTERQIAVIGTSRIDHELLFKAPTDEDAASFYIEIEQTAGTVYIDNIAFYEATSGGELVGTNKYPYGQFESNINNVYAYSKNSNHVAAWDGSRKITSTYYYTVKDAKGNTGVAEIKTKRPVSALAAAAKASKSITSSTGTTSVTVSASGGTAPYTGTGTFTKGVGTHNFTVTDANGCTSVATVTLSVSAAARTLSTATSITDSTVATTSAAAEELTVSEASALKISAFPNPSSTSFGLVLEGGSNEKVSIQVYSAEGKILYQTTGNTNMKYTFGNSFMAGVYIVKVVQGNTIQSLKLLKTN